LSEHIILIGAYGWQHPHWDEIFYPEDLPVEWKIGYYGNEYAVAVVPNSYWQADSGQYAQWLEESDDELQFICEWPAMGATQSEYQHAQHGMEILGQRVVGVLIPIAAMPSELDWQYIYGIAEQQKISFDLSPELRTAFMAEIGQRLPEIKYGLCWDGKQETHGDIQSGTMGICRIEGDREPKELRLLMETMLAASDGQRHLVLIVDGAPPDMKLLTNAGIILDLL